MKLGNFWVVGVKPEARSEYSLPSSSEICIEFFGKTYKEPFVDVGEGGVKKELSTRAFKAALRRDVDREELQFQSLNDDNMLGLMMVSTQSIGRAKVTIYLAESAYWDMRDFIIYDKMRGDKDAIIQTVRTSLREAYIILQKVD